jgi:hypothetical protein
MTITFRSSCCCFSHEWIYTDLLQHGTLKGLSHPNTGRHFCAFTFSVPPYRDASPWYLLLPNTSMPQPSTESNFRSNLSQFRWAQGVTDDSQPAQSSSQPSNPFSRFYNSVGDYVPLRSNERSNEEEAWFALSRWERCGELLGHRL